MSASDNKTELSEYFQIVCQFFHSYRWVYDFKGTHILTQKVIDTIPVTFQQYFMHLDERSEEFLKILSLCKQDDWPPEIKQFTDECRHLKSLAAKFQTSSFSTLGPTKDMKLPRKWNLKKYNEVVHVGNFVGTKCKSEGCDAVVDIGSGLGYLSHHIASNFYLPVIGIESDHSRVKTASSTLLEEGAVSKQSFHCLRITENISEELQPFVETCTNIGVTALHACGDLTPWSLKYFIKNSACKVVAVVPCCYHKMSPEAKNFPLSSSLSQALFGYEDITFLKNQWLWRLACQRSGSQFLNDIGRETKHHFFRAILERVCLEESLTLKRLKRNLQHVGDDLFSDYVEAMLGENGGFQLFRNDQVVDSVDKLKAQQLLLTEYEQLKPWSRVITGILAMQGAIQEIAESVILVDRLALLKEASVVSVAGIMKVIPDQITPRGMVLFGVKATGGKNISSKSRLKELLKKMPKETTHVPILREGRKAKKENLVKYPAGIINLQVLGNGCKGAPRALYVFTDQTRYMFNCGEGTQRLAHEHKMKLAKLEHIFITNNSWDATGGLPGVALTIQDIGVPEITLHGPPRLEKLFEGTRRFVILKDLKIKVANTGAKGYEDHILEVDYVRLYPSKVEESTDKTGSSSEESVIEEDETDYYAPIKGCKRHLEITQDPPEKRTRTEVGSELAEDSTPQGDPETVMCYVCRPKKKEGMLLIEKCVEMGVPAGPLLGKLKAGNDVTLANGKVVKAQDVRSPDCPGPVFIVVDCPRESYLDSLTENPALMSYHNPSNQDDFPHIVVHFSPLEVMTQSKYKLWMEKFPPNTKHMLLNDACIGMGSEAVHRIQHKLNILDKNMFPPLNENGVELYFPASEEASTNKLDILKKPDSLKDLKVPIVMGATLLRYALRPTVELESSSSLIIHPEENVREVLEIENFPAILEEMKSKSAALGASCDDGVYPEFVFFGTGSCIPNKTRNTSAILVNTDPSSCILLDCGEGTYGQLVRFFGNDGVDDVLIKLKAIYVSHLHADHHIGLIQVIRKRYSALINRKIPPSPVYLMAPHQIQTWLHLYNKSFEKIRSAYQLIPNVELRLNADVTTESIFTSEVKQTLGLAQIQTAYVRHCPNAFGVALTHSLGWKVTYSGDTMPCNTLVEIGMNSDVLIHEATMEDDLKKEAVIKMHSTTSEAIEIGNQMNAKFILLTHFSQRYAKVPVINENFGSNVGIAFDNMRVRKCDLPKIPLMYDALKAMFTEDVEEMEQKTVRRMKRKEHEAMNLKQVSR